MLAFPLLIRYYRNMNTYPNLPPEKFVNHILATVANPKGDMDNARAIVEAVWEKTQNTVVAKSANDVVLDYIAADEALLTKVNQVRSVISNTLHKRNLVAPPEFVWATYGGGGIYVRGIFRKKSVFHQEMNRVRDTRSAPDNFSVKVEMRLALGKEITAYIPVSWLSLSDGEISKMVRDRVRAIAQEGETRKIGELKAQKRKMEAELAKLNAQIEEGIAALKK